VRVALADDSALFRGGLALLLGRVGVEVVIEAGNGDDLLRQVAAAQPDVVLLDVRMPPSFTDEGLTTAQRLRDRYPHVGLLLLSTYAETPYATRLFRFAATGAGYLLKDGVANLETLRDALVRVGRGEWVLAPELVERLLTRQHVGSRLDRLTHRERDVLQLMAEGRSNLGIGQTLYLGSKTVEAHVTAVLNKLGLPPAPDDNRRVLAVLTWLRATA
jgi:DNA-binding NarL/FixJ family response regulator